MKTLELMSLKNKFSPGLIFFIILTILPFGAAFGYALLYSFGLVGMLNSGFTLQYWVSVFQDGQLVNSFLYSGIIAAIAVIFSVATAIFIVLYLKQELKKPALNFIIYMPLAVPGIVSAFFTYQLFSRTGFFSRLAFKTGTINQVASFPDLINDNLAFGITLTFVTLLSPFFVLLYLNIYKNENVASLEQVAISLGASKKLTIYKVALPILLKKSWTLIVLYFIFLLGSYEVPLILGQESPQMLSVLILRELKQFDLAKIPEGYVMAVIYTLVVSLLAAIVFSAKKTERNYAD